MKHEELFWKIFSAQNEDELHEFVISNELLTNPDNWYPYGGDNKEDRSNFSTFVSQQANPIPALIEKITNSIDTMLLKHCRMENIEPESELAPRNMAGAVERFFGIKNGDFSEISRGARRSIAEDIQVIAEGDKKTPNIIIYDNGEGQLPQDFPNTFLSISRCNKTNIPFVQGKFNMGATGGVIFCGEHRYQLVMSRLCNELSEGNNNDIGFTLVRRHPLSDREERSFKGSWYEYLIIDGKIPSFPFKKPIDLGLYKRKFETGSIVKMYSYGLPRGSTSSIIWDLWRDLNQYLYHPALPFIVYENRGYDKKTPSKPVLGNKTRLILDERDKKEQTITTTITDSTIGEVNIEIHVFNQGVKQKEFINNKAIIFTLNGQVHGSFPRAFISQELGFSMLRDHILVQVDCTNMRTSFREDIFKGSRDRLNEGKKTELLMDRIVNLLKHNDLLRDLNQNRKNRIIRESLEDSDILSEVFSQIPIDDDLMKLLKHNDQLNIFKIKKNNHQKKNEPKRDGQEKKTISRRFPSVFKINLPEDADGRIVKSIPLNGKGIIQFQTDVEDEYFFRPKDKGEFEISILDFNENDSTGGNDSTPSVPEDVFNVTRSGPTDNSIKITFEPKENLSVGDQIKINARLSSPDGDLESVFWIKISEKQTASPKKKDPKKDKSLAPPKPIRVYKNGENEDDLTWSAYGWDGNDIVRIITGEVSDGNVAVEAIAVNMDSYQLTKYLSKLRNPSQKDIAQVKNKYFLSIYLHSLFLYGILTHMNRDEGVEFTLDSEEVLPVLFKPYSTFLLRFGMMDGVGMT